MDDLKWRTAAIVLTVVAALEFVALAGAGVAIFGNPLATNLSAGTAKAAARKVTRSRPLPTKTSLARSDTVVMVLNGNGRTGSAAAAAHQLRARGYRGYAAEAVRLARDLHVHIVSPLDGMRPARLMGAHLVLIVGVG
jgi:hypothetical protein